MALQIPEKLEQLLLMVYRDRAQEVLAEYAIVELVRSGEVSSKKAAELMDMSQADFDQVLARHEVPSLDMTLEELKAEEQVWNQLRKPA